MKKYEAIIDLILSAIALAMSVASIVLGIVDAAALETIVTLLGIGFFALALGSLQKAESGEL